MNWIERLRDPDFRLGPADRGMIAHTLAAYVEEVAALQASLVEKDIWLKMPRRLFDKRTVTKTGCWEWDGARSIQGYGNLWLPGGGSITAHRASAVVFLGLDLAGEDWVLHRCDNAPCFNPEHLYFGDEEQNRRDYNERTRPALRGEQRPTAKLTAQRVVDIRTRAAAGERHVDLAAEYGVHPSTVRAVVLRKRWAHVPGEESADV